MVDLKTLLLVVATVDVAVALVLAAGSGRRLRFGIAPWLGSLFTRALAIWEHPWWRRWAGCLAANPCCWR